MDNVYMRE